MDKKSLLNAIEKHAEAEDKAYSDLIDYIQEIRENSLKEHGYLLDTIDKYLKQK